MVWLPANYDGSCNASSNNHTLPLTLMCFLIKYFGGSNDDILKDIYSAQDSTVTEFDFIVVGAGTAGCVVANRLSEQSNWKLLFQSPSKFQLPLAAAVPRLSRTIIGSTIDYSYPVNNTESMVYAQGKVMGGTSTINSMTYSRGSKVDYDEWAAMGNDGWSWYDVLAYFKKSESLRDPEILDKYSQYHGTSGNLVVERFPTEDKRVPLFIEAFKEAGLKETDYNMGDLSGVSRILATNVHGSRLSTNGAFIRPIRGKRANLFVRPNARVTRIIIDAKTKRATGVEYELKNSDGSVNKKNANAAKEVIISAGFVGSPKLLMLSGIGPKDALQRLNVTLIEDLPVGRNLRDHCVVRLTLGSSSNITTMNDTTRQGHLFEWLNTHEGLMSSRVDISIIAFYQTQFEPQPGAADITYEVWGEATQEDGSFGRATFVVNLCRSESQGNITLNSVDPLNGQPNIVYDPIVDSTDAERLFEGLKFARKVSDMPALKDEGIFIIPVTECQNHDFYSDDYLRCLIEKNAVQDSHATGTCKMGPANDSSAVVDAQLKVYGVKSLRVIDSSIMPVITRSAPYAPVIMIGEKGSDMIKGHWLKK